MKLGLDN